MSSGIPTKANTVFRDYVINNVPSSGDHEPAKSEIRETFQMVGDEIDSIIPELDLLVDQVNSSLVSAQAAEAGAEAALATVEGLVDGAATGYLSFETTAAMEAYTTATEGQTAYNLETDSYYRWDDVGNSWEFVRLAETPRIDELEDRLLKSITDTDMVGNPIGVITDNAAEPNLFVVFNRDGTTWLQLDQDAIDYLAPRLPNVPSAAPESLFEESVEARPYLGYLQSTDEEGWPETYVYRLDVATPNVAIALHSEPVELCGSDGESLNLDGGNTTSEIITAPPYPHRALTLTGSLSGGPIFAGLDPISEAVLTDLKPCFEASGQKKDCPTTSMLRYAASLDIADGLAPPIRISWASGAGGRLIADVMKPSTLYDNDMLVTRRAIELIRAHGFRDVVAYVLDLDIGSNDRSGTTTNATWVSNYTMYRADKEADIKAITRQKEPVWISMRSVANGPGTSHVGKAFTPIAQYDCMTTLPRTTISHNDYFLQGAYGQGDDGVHVTSLGQDLRGEYRAKARRRITQKIKEAVAQGIDPETLTYQDMATCLAVIGATRVGATVTLDLLMPWDSTTVVEDTTTLPLGNATGIVKGLKLDTGSGSISSVAVVNPSAGVYKLEVGLSVAGAGAIRGGVDPIDTAVLDRANGWTNFKAGSSLESIAVPGLMLDNWLIPFKISYS